jgi:hypothetical protein
MAGEESAEVVQAIEAAGGVQQIVRLLSEGPELKYNAATALAAVAMGAKAGPWGKLARCRC